MGCGGCSKHVDQVAPPHKPYKTTPGGAVPGKDKLARRDPAYVAAKNGDATSVHAQQASRQTVEARRVSEAKTPHNGAHAGSTPPLRQAGSFDEQLLTEGSQVQGLLIVPWDESDADVVSNFGLGRCPAVGSTTPATGCFEDVDGLLELSSRQREALHAWQRFPELLRTSKGSNGAQPVVFAAAVESSSIRQGLVGDCSFLSALSVLAEYERKFGEPVLSSIIYPRYQGKPIYNDYGQYGCRLFLNGTLRKVVVDDRVPVRSNGQLLCAHSMNAQELWVTLLEKSFAKIMGSSYDMQGSNPGTDVFHLTGWIPETIPLSGSDRDTAAWNELFRTSEKGYHGGQCIVCVGTSELPDAAPDSDARRLGHVEGVSVSTGLVARHAYPVLDCCCIGQNRLLHLKNPWGRVRWRGRFAPGDTVSWADVRKASDVRKLSDKFGYDPSVNCNDDGHFWIAWEDLLKHFSHLYLCWSPRAMGLHKLETHGCWNPDPLFTHSSLPDDTHLVAFNPQFLLRLDTPLPEDASGEIWVLLSRHVNDRKDITSRYVAAHIYNSGSRLCCPDAPQEMGVYSNGECALVRLRNAGKGQQEFVFVISQHASKVPFNFTLHVYSSVPGVLKPLPPLVPESFASGYADDSWTPETSGGCSNDIWGYFSNPQWRIEVPPGGVESLMLFVECLSEHSVNVRLFRGTVAQPELLRSAESSGAYRQGCCMLRLENLPEGPHIAVVSTFRRGLLGNYRIAWYASKEIQLKPQPYPFAAPLRSPLEHLVHAVTCGVRTRLCIRPRDSDKGAAQVSACSKEQVLLSVRLQCDFKIGLPPLLHLMCEAPAVAGSNPQAGDTSPPQPAMCKRLKESYAENYFACTGASVILLAEFLPGESRILEVLVPHAGSGSISLHLNSNCPLVLDDVTAASVGRRLNGLEA